MSVNANNELDLSTNVINLGLFVNNGPVFTAPGSAALQQSNFAPQSVVEVETASGAIGIKSGLAVVTKGSIAALTLALPTAGSIVTGGDDGKRLRVVSTTAFAHTVTTPASGINGASHVATFSGTLPNFVELIAYNGTWWSLASAGNTLS